MTTDDAPLVFFDEVGGHDVFERLVHEFYRGVREDPVLSPMYPQNDWDGAERRLRTFLEQYWGGPDEYRRTRGEARLIRRHRAYHINPEARDRWLGHMRRALDLLDLPPLHEATIWTYVERSAYALVNTFQPTPTHGDDV